MGLELQCCITCIPFPPYKWTAWHRHRYGIKPKKTTTIHQLGQISEKHCYISETHFIFFHLNILCLFTKTSAETDLKQTSKSQDSLSSGIHVTVASDDTMFMAITPETDTHTGLTPQLPQPSVKSSLMDSSRLCGNLRYPSLPESLDIQSRLAEIQKHLSDPVLPIV